MTADEPTHSAAIRIVIAEDQALVRRGAALLLSMEPDMEVVGQACNGVEAVELAELLRPDVVLMDLHMPVKGGVAATREITRALPGTQMLVLTTLDDDETVFEAVRAGAHAYLLKDADENELLETIRALRRGESRLTPQIARKVMDQFRRLAPAATPASVRGRRAIRRRRARGRAAPPHRGRRFNPDPLTDKEEKDPAAHRRRHEQPADRQRPVSRRRHRQELRQPHHGEAACQYAHRARDHVAQAAETMVAADGTTAVPLASRDFSHS